MLLGHTKWRLNIYFSEWDTEYLNIMEIIQEPEVVILEFVIWMIALYIFNLYFGFFCLIDSFPDDEDLVHAEITEERRSEPLKLCTAPEPVCVI